MDDKESNENLIKKIKKFKRIVIWGKAFLGTEIEKYLRQNDIRICSFWDRNAKKLENSSDIPVLIPFDEEVKESTVFILAAGNVSVRKKMRDVLKNKGLNDILDENEHRCLINKSLSSLEHDMETKFVYEEKEYPLKLKLEKAVDFAIKFDHIQWYQQPFLIEKLRLRTNVCCFGNFDMTHFWTKFFENNGIQITHYASFEDEQKVGIGKANYISYKDLKDIDDLSIVVFWDKDGNDLKRLKQMGFHAIPISYLCLNVFDQYHKGSEWFAAEKDHIIGCLDLFADQASKEIYVEVFCNRVAKHLAGKSFLEMCKGKEYFDDEIFRFSENETFIDCGAYLGESIEEFSKVVNNNYKGIHSFELDKDCFEVLKNKTKDERIKIYNVGLSDQNKELFYQPNGAGGSNVCDWAEHKVLLRRLDDVLVDEDISFLKMDIEGSEKQALDGGKCLIGKNKPKMAISVYHYLEDLWKIPMWIYGIDSKYKLILRHHSRSVWDTDCYAYIES